MRALLLSNSLIEIQLRKRLQGLSDAADHTGYFPPSQLLKDEFKSVHTKDLRSHHLSWEVLQTLIHQQLNVQIDLEKDELGWIQVSRAGTKYIPITDELTFHNAVGVLHNSSPLETGSLIAIHLWSPRPEDPFFRRSRRAPLAPDEAPGGLSEKADGGAAKPASPRRSSTSPPPGGLPKAVSRPTTPVTIPSTPADLPSQPGSLPPEDASVPPPSPSNILPVSPGPPSSEDDEFEFDINLLLEKQSQNQLVAPEQDEDEDDDDFLARVAEYQEQLAENVMERYASPFPTHIVPITNTSKSDFSMSWIARSASTWTKRSG